MTGFAQRLQPNGSIREGERRHRRQHACRRQAAPWVRVLATRKHLLSSDWNGTLRFHSFGARASIGCYSMLQSCVCLCSVL